MSKLVFQPFTLAATVNERRNDAAALKSSRPWESFPSDPEMKMSDHRPVFNPAVQLCVCPLSFHMTSALPGIRKLRAEDDDVCPEQTGLILMSLFWGTGVCGTSSESKSHGGGEQVQAWGADDDDELCPVRQDPEHLYNVPVCVFVCVTEYNHLHSCPVMLKQASIFYLSPELTYI